MNQYKTFRRDVVLITFDCWGFTGRSTILTRQVEKNRVVHKITQSNQNPKAELSKKEEPRNGIMPEPNHLPDFHVLHIYPKSILLVFF